MRSQITENSNPRSCVGLIAADFNFLWAGPRLHKSYSIK